MKFLPLLLIVVATAMAAVEYGKDNEPGDCPNANEEWSECMGEMDQSCVLMREIEAGFGHPDATACYPGCICVRGYYRDNDKVCIPEEKCEKPQSVIDRENFMKLPLPE